MEQQYEERYVSFIDILGFSALINRAEVEVNLLDRLTSSLQDVQMYHAIGKNMDVSGDPDGFFKNMYRMSTFSDNIVISTKVNLIGLGLITTLCAIICNRLLHQGIFTRGAISKGKLIHTDSIVLGMGLIKAYELEVKAAIYPRILIDENVRNDMDALVAQGGTPDIRRQDFDGLCHLHIFHPMILDLNSHTSKSEFAVLNKYEYMTLGRQQIENEYRSNFNNLAIKAKIGWLAKYFNEYADKFKLPEIKTD